MNIDLSSPKAKLVRKRVGRVSFVTARAILCIGFAYTILYPLIMMISRAFMAAEDLYDNSVVWIPKTFTLDTVRAMIKVLDYPEGLWNSIWICLSYGKKTEKSIVFQSMRILWDLRLIGEKTMK